MLQITIPARELWDETRNEFVYRKEQTLQLEHSLVSLSKWESKWCKAFLSKKDKTYEETIDYIKCMTLTQNVSPDTYKYLTEDNFAQIEKYITAPMTATVFSEYGLVKNGSQVVTSEVIYYWMIALNIPPEYQKWHLNRLLTLIRVCNIKNQPPKKRSSRDIMSRNAALNAKRRKQLNSKG
jgi:hypothetical protein